MVAKLKAKAIQKTAPKKAKTIKKSIASSPCKQST
jgi:hypothetical protein